MKNFLMILTCVTIGSIAQLSLKHGMTAVGRITADTSALVGTYARAFTNPYVVIGFALYGTASLLWMVVISRVPLSWAYPMISMGYIVVVIMSKVLFHEQVSPMRFAGTLVICAGVVLISRS